MEDTPLMMATRFGHSSTADILLRNGADKNRADDKAWTSLMRAAANGHTKVVVAFFGYHPSPHQGVIPVPGYQPSPDHI